MGSRPTLTYRAIHGSVWVGFVLNLESIQPFESLRFGLVVEDSVVANLFSVRIGDEELTEIWLKLVEIRQIWKKMAEFREILPNFYKIWVDLNRSDLK